MQWEQSRLQTELLKTARLASELRGDLNCNGEPEFDSIFAELAQDSLALEHLVAAVGPVNRFGEPLVSAVRLFKRYDDWAGDDDWAGGGDWAGDDDLAGNDEMLHVRSSLERAPRSQNTS